VLSDLDDLEEREVALPACVARPRSTDDVVAVVNHCRQAGAPLVPAGLRSGVCGGLLASTASVVLDMSALSAVRHIDEGDLIGTFDAGVRGGDAERAVSERGLSIGHFPQSIELSSVGGWVATRAAGQFSTGYGNIEDLLLGLSAVLPDGSVFCSNSSPRASAGPDLRHLLLGSEGTLGVITEVSLALRTAPAHRRCAAYYTPAMQTGFDAQRSVLQAGYTPAVLRQYDSREVGRLFGKFRSDDQGLILVVHEGPQGRTDDEWESTRQLMVAAGCTAGPEAATEQWLSERNKVPSFNSFLKSGIMVDTIEVAAPYSRIGALYDNAIERLSTIAGIWNGSAHSSHAYRTGLNLYFSFAVQPAAREDLRQAYWQCWEAVMEATLGAGGTISHHHGIGRVRRQWLSRELGGGRLGALRAVKAALDPTGFMNPGALIPDPD
jgi:alkyldihydroxyacetonephosphate synthase